MWTIVSYRNTQEHLHPLSTRNTASTGEDADVIADSVPGTAALAKGITVMRAIASQGRAPQFAQIQQATQLPKGTLHRMLKALTAEGFVRQQASDRSYHLGFQLLTMTSQVLDDLDVRDIARDELVRLRDLTGEAVHLAVRDDLRAIYIDVVESGSAVGPTWKIGSSSGLHSSAVGKAIAAFLAPDERSDALRRLPMTPRTEHTITSRRSLAAHLDTVYRQGYALNEQEECLGIHGVAAPVFDHFGSVVASVCVTIPSYRYETANLATIASAVVEAGAVISQRLGYGKLDAARTGSS